MKSLIWASLTGEALYLPPQREMPYFKGTIDTLFYEFAS